MTPTLASGKRPLQHRSLLARWPRWPDRELVGLWVVSTLSAAGLLHVAGPGLDGGGGAAAAWGGLFTTVVFAVVRRVVARRRDGSGAGMAALLGRFRNRSLAMAVDVAKTAHRIEQGLERSERQERLAETVLSAGRQSSAALLEMSEAVQVIAAACGVSVQRSRASVDRLASTRQRAGAVEQQAHEFSAAVEALAQQSLQVQQAVQTVSDIARQTNLLSLNAAIEAARAGELGRGFGVVASEVRALSTNVQQTAASIASIVADTLALAQRTAQASQAVRSEVSAVRDAIESVAADCGGVLVDMESVNESTSRLAATAEQLSAANTSILESMVASHGLSVEVSRVLRSTQDSSQALFLGAEQIQEELSGLQLDDGVLEAKVRQCSQWAEGIARVLAGLQAEGHALFDTQYQRIAGTRPEQFMVTYQPAFERAVQPLLDAARTELGAQACACIALDCYTPTNNSEYARPPAGDPVVDTVHCRDKRFMTQGEQGRRSATHPGRMLLQTYVRDNGKLCCEVAVPFHVGGRRWGALRAAFDPAVLMSASV